MIRRRWLLAAGAFLVSAAAGTHAAGRAGNAGSAGAAAPVAEGCIECHAGIEPMHPWHELSCTACHGGDPRATRKEQAHVRPRAAPPNDERLLPRDYDPAWIQFVNPSDLRVVGRTCGTCHQTECDDLWKSLHATTAGHLSDGLYENGLSKVNPVGSPDTDRNNSSVVMPFDPSARSPSMARPKASSPRKARW